MNRYGLIRGLWWPAFVVLVGVNALLANAHILGWGQSWPFYLILAGVLLLAQRAALAAEGYPGAPYAGANSAGPAQPAAAQNTSSAATAETALSPKRHEGFENDVNGGQS